MALLTEQDKITKRLIVLQNKIHEEYEEIVPLFHVYRLIIMVHLNAQIRSFKELKMITTLSDGNLASHLRPLDQLGMIEVIKEFVGRRPKTSYKITPKGKACLGRIRKIFDEVTYHL